MREEKLARIATSIFWLLRRRIYRCDRFPAVRRLLADFPAAFDVFWKTPDEYDRWRTVVNHVVYFADKYGRVVYKRQDARSGAAVVG